MKIQRQFNVSIKEGTFVWYVLWSSVQTLEYHNNQKYSITLIITIKSISYEHGLKENFKYTFNSSELIKRKYVS